MRDEARFGVIKHLRLTHDSALTIIEAAVAKAAAMVARLLFAADDPTNVGTMATITFAKDVRRSRNAW
jgi:hypothetical protein